MTRLLSVVSQDYVARVHEIDVILGNAGLLKCEIPSFVIDFVSVINWVNDQGEELFSAHNSIGKQSSLFIIKKSHMTWETQAKLSSFKISPLVYSSEKRVHDSYFESGLFFQYFFKIMQLE